MEHVEEVLFKAERALMRRYPSRAKLIADTTKDLWHRGGVSGMYCAILMAKAIGMDSDTVTPFYFQAEDETRQVEAERQQARKDRKRAIFWSVYCVVMVCVAAVVVAYN